jgi:ABC-2 type transport system ATP-binding protein
MTDSVIQAEGLWRRYGKGKKAFDAVRGVSFSVLQGELFALLGTNGAGKTSTVELLEGLASPARGEIRLFGEHDPVRDRAKVRPRTGVMLQEGGFANELTCAETLRMWSGFTTDPAPVGDALKLTGLAERSDVLVKNLSGGEKRRLDLAMATLGSPDLLFLDEPTTGMDPEGRHVTWEIIRSLKDRGATIVLTTHYLEEAEQLADHLAIMRAGEIAASGTVAEIVTAYPSTLSFRLPDDLTTDDLPQLDGVSAPGDVTVTDGAVRVATTDLQTTATDLLVWARNKSVLLDGLHARSASLEEVFLQVAHESEEDETA